MKKTAKCSIFLIFAAMFVLASFSPSVDGRAVVANMGEMPEGLFAKSVGYLPGDTLSVTNMVTRQTASVLVVGSLDASEGVAILLSPEAANVLGIAKNSNIVVKITKRPDEIDKAFVGNAFVAKDDVSAATADKSPIADTPVESKNIVAPSVSKATETVNTPAPVVTPSPVADTKPVVEHTYVPVDTAPVASVAPSPVAKTATAPKTTEPKSDSNLSGASAVETLPREIKEVAKVPATSTSNNTVNQVPKTEGKLPKDSVVVLEEKEPKKGFVSEFLPVDNAENSAEKVTQKNISPSPVVKTEEKLPVDSVIVTEEEPPMRKVAEENKPVVVVSESIPAPYDVPSEHIALTEEPAKNDIAREKFVAETIPSRIEDVPARNAVPLHDTLPPVFEEPVKSAIVEEKPPVEEKSPVKSYVAADITPAVEEKPPVEEKTPVKSYVAADIIPAVEEKPPVEEKTPVSGSDTYAPIVLVPAEMNPPETEKSEVVEHKPTKNISQEVKPASNLIASLPSTSSYEFEKYIVKDLNSLKRGSYYVQVATMADKSNMNNMVKNYGNNYPLAFVPSSNGKMMQVMVGPLSVDEYEVVMTRFKSFGFEDSFLRKIK